MLSTCLASQMLPGQGWSATMGSRVECFGERRCAKLPALAVQLLEELQCQRAGRRRVLPRIEIAVDEHVRFPERSLAVIDAQLSQFVLSGPPGFGAQPYGVLFLVRETGGAITGEGIGPIATGRHHGDGRVAHDGQRLT